MELSLALMKCVGRTNTDGLRACVGQRVDDVSGSVVPNVNRDVFAIVKVEIRAGRRRTRSTFR